MEQAAKAEGGGFAKVIPRGGGGVYVPRILGRKRRRRRRQEFIDPILGKQGAAEAEK